MNEEDKKIQKQLVDEMMKVSKTNPDVMIYMQALMKKYEELEKENKELSKMCELYSKSLYNADLKRAKKELDQYKNNWEELKTYLNMVIGMNFNMNNDKLSEQKVNDYTDILNKMKELEDEQNFQR